MSAQDTGRDPMNDPSFRAAVVKADRTQIILTAKYHDGTWTVTVKYRYGSPGMHPDGMMARATGATAGHAAWQTLATLEG